MRSDWKENKGSLFVLFMQVGAGTGLVTAHCGIVAE